MHEWDILLICGASGTGKTRLAQQLARRFGVSILLADDVRMALQHVTTPEQLPALHYFLSRVDIESQSPDDLGAGWRGVAEIVSRSLEIVIAHHLVVRDAGQLIIEGDAILPGLATQVAFANLRGVAPGRVRGVVLHEADRGALLDNMCSRQRGFEHLPPDQQQMMATGAHRFGDILKVDAEAAGVPVVAARPWTTLEMRALQALELTP